MVIRTPSLSSLKSGFLKRIHPQVLDDRSSQKLLQSITSSFRKNLDQEHPWETDKSSTTNATEGVRAPSVTSPLTVNEVPTARHLHAILTNPLFTSPREGGTREKDGLFLIFDKAVSRGLMTPRRAAGFLAKVRSQVVGQSSDSIHHRLGTSGAGLHVLRWLRTSGQEQDLSFLYEPILTRLLVSFLYAEGLREVPWAWLAQLAARNNTPEPQNALDQVRAEPLSDLLSVIVTEHGKSDSQTPISLDGSFEALTRANGMLPRENATATVAFQKMWAKLSWASTVDALQRPKPSVSLFEDFVHIGQPMNLPLDLAHLDLHHPTKPTHSAAIEYLDHRRNIVKALPKEKPLVQKRVLSLVLDTGESLRRSGLGSQAPWVESIRNAIYESLKLGNLDLRIGDRRNLNNPIIRGT